MGLDRTLAWLAFAVLGLPALACANHKAATVTPPQTAAGAAAQAAAPAELEEPDLDPWPRLLEGDTHSLRIHPPQVESWNGTQLTARVAVEVLEKGKDSPIYGVVAFSARTRVDKEARLVVIDEFLARTASLPSAPEAEPRLLGFVQKKLYDVMKVVSLDRLEAALAAGDQEREAQSLPTRNEPPAIVFAERPTLLVLVGGEPVWRAVEGAAGWERLINTRPLILRDGGGTAYLHLFDGWLAAPALEGPWRVAAKPPAGLAAAAETSAAAIPADLLDGGAAEEVDEEGKPIPRPTLAKGPVPEILVATEATELVVIDGVPGWTAIPGTGLEFVSNTRGNVFRQSGTFWVLLSGRWFSAPSLAGPWSFVPQDRLAADFTRIPDESPKENVKASVAGTPQAAEAAIANSIPQTAQVDRAKAELKPQIDGEPKLEPIAGTGLSYVVNSPVPIVETAPGEFYAVDKGVWFQAPAAAGPWKVATAVPEAIYSIPPESPLHYVTYVRVLGSNDEVVEVAYTPGYYGAVESGGVVVCGTGYSYDPWVGSYYYAAPATWGYSCTMGYTPWGGWAWGFGVGWAWGYWGSWYGPYYPPYWGAYYPWYGGAVVGSGGGWAAWGPGGWAGSTGNIYRQWGSVSSVSRYSGGFDAWSGTGWRSSVGAAYNSRTGNLAAGQRGAVGNVYSGRYAYGGRGAVRNTESGATVAGGRVTMGDVDSGRQVTAGRVGAADPGSGQAGSAGWVRGEQGGVARVGDDYYAGKDGSVYKRGEDGWSQVERSGDWGRVQDTSRTRDLDRQQRARSTGSQRYGGYRGSMPSGGGMRGGGMRGGGGGRRR